MTVVSDAMKESQEPDFAGAIRLMEGSIIRDKEDLSGLQGDLSAHWKRIEEVHRCNRQAAKVYLSKVHNASDDNANDFIRTFIGLCRESGKLEGMKDLVDAMEAAGANDGDEKEPEPGAAPPSKPAKPVDERPALH